MSLLVEPLAIGNGGGKSVGGHHGDQPDVPVGLRDNDGPHPLAADR